MKETDRVRMRESEQKKKDIGTNRRINIDIAYTIRVVKSLWTAWKNKKLEPLMHKFAYFHFWINHLMENWNWIKFRALFSVVVVLYFSYYFVHVLNSCHDMYLFCLCRSVRVYHHFSCTVDPNICIGNVINVHKVILWIDFQMFNRSNCIDSIIESRQTEFITNKQSA